MNITNTQNVSNTQNMMDKIDLGPTESIQLMFAKLQLAQAQMCKDQAESYINKIQNNQKEQKECAEMISRARALQNQAKKDNKPVEMPQDMVDYFKKHSLTFDTSGNDNSHSKDEWDVNIKSLTNFQDSLGSTTQTDMVFLQDFLGQYNSFLQGANAAIKQSNETMQIIARG